MAFTLLDSISEIRYLINEEIPSYWSDTEIISWLAQGCLDWCEKTLLLTREDTITLATSTYKYTTSGSSFIDDAIRTLHAEFDGKALKRLSYEQIRGHNKMVLSTDEDPEYFYDKYDGLIFTFYIGDVPSATQDAKDVTVLFAVRTDDITEIPHEYQANIFNYAASKAKMKERQWQEAQLLWQIYLNNLGFARKDKVEIPVQTSEHFKEQ